LILYGGIFSVGIAYTLQVAGQKHAHPSSASIVLSLESLFAVIGGWLILNEEISARGLAGCALMLCGMVLAHISFKRRGRE
jgi:drug/metabolite transporter (DMT)-like permease